MTAELFQNLISNTTQSAQTLNSQTTVSEVFGENQTNAFGDALNSAKSKYISKDSNNIESKKASFETASNSATESKAKTEVKAEAKTDNKTNSLKNEFSTDLQENNTPNTDKSELEQISTKKDNITNKNEEIENTENKTNDLLLFTVVEKLNNKIENQKTEIAANEENIQVSEIDLNAATNDETIISQNLGFSTQITEENDNLNQKSENKINRTEQKNENLQALKTNTKEIIETSSNTTQNEQSVNIQTNNNEISDKSVNNFTEENIVSEKDTTQNDVMVSLELEDELITENIDEVVQIENTSKISQEIIDDLDVTIRSVDSSLQSNTAENAKGQNNSSNNGFSTSKNAAEDIIKMSLEKSETSEPTEFVELTETSVETQTSGLSDGNNQLINKVELNNSNVSQANNLNQPTLSQQKTISDSDIISQINTKLQSSADGMTNKVNIILNPESLGKVSVEILQTKDGVAAKFLAETPQVKELLDKSIESLKNSIAQQGVNVSNITVKVEQSTGAQNAGFGFEQEEFSHEFTKQFGHSQEGNHSRQNEVENQTENINTAIEDTGETTETEILSEHIETNTDKKPDGSTISVRV